MTIPPEQQDTAGFLAALSGSPPRETHISAVFVGSDTAWKLKKAVRLPFLDFSTMENRRHFLCRELSLNQPLAPGIYRDVVPVGRCKDGSLAINEGEPVDWVLRMAPVPARDFLDAVAERGELTAILQDRLGDCVAECHARLPSVRDWDCAGRMEAIARGNADSAQVAGLPGERVAAWLDQCLQAIGTLQDWLSDRAAAGFVRRCHGDLHLGNLCLWDGVPVAFDALEFNEAMATIDTGYDLAFLLMDLDQRVGRAAANRVMNRYLARNGDADLVAGLRLFLSQRAMVRAHVTASIGDAAKGRGLLDAALSYLPGGPVRVVAIGGLQGTGKTTLARALAPGLGAAPGAVVVRSDEVRKRLFDRKPEDRLPPDAYSEAANARVNEALIDAVCRTAQGGHSAIADSTFLPHAMRDALESRMRQMGVPFTGLWLDAPVPELERRIQSRADDASDATIDVLRRSAASGPTPGTWTVLDARNGAAVLLAAKRVLKLA